MKGSIKSRTSAGAALLAYLKSWISRDKPHVKYTATRRLHVAEIHLVDVEALIKDRLRCGVAAMAQNDEVLKLARSVSEGLAEDFSRLLAQNFTANTLVLGRRTARTQWRLPRPAASRLDDAVRLVDAALLREMQVEMRTGLKQRCAPPRF